MIPAFLLALAAVLACRPPVPLLLLFLAAWAPVFVGMVHHHALRILPRLRRLVHRLQALNPAPIPKGSP